MKASWLGHSADGGSSRGFLEEALEASWSLRIQWNTGRRCPLSVALKAVSPSPAIQSAWISAMQASRTVRSFCCFSASWCSVLGSNSWNRQRHQHFFSSLCLSSLPTSKLAFKAKTSQIPSLGPLIPALLSFSVWPGLRKYPGLLLQIPYRQTFLNCFQAAIATTTFTELHSIQQWSLKEETLSWDLCSFFLCFGI